MQRCMCQLEQNQKYKEAKGWKEFTNIEEIQL